MLDAFKLLARYNRVANQRLYEHCARLSDEEYRLPRKVSFGSIHNLLNHMLLADGIWMSRFTGGGKTTPPLNTILFDSFQELQGARTIQDEAIEAFFATANEAFLTQPLRYTNSRGIDYTDVASWAVLHFFNHQTHHRGQVHVLLSQTEVGPPALDMHRVLNP
jgi:uncharacterized damage-inducible protein DinB